MRKFYSLLTLAIVTMLAGFKASAGTTWNFTIDIDNPNAVVVSQNYDGSNPISLIAGSNNVSFYDEWGNGAYFYIKCKGDYVFTSIKCNGSEESLYDNTSYSGYVNSQNMKFVVRTADLNALRTEYVTVNIDNAAGASLMRNGGSSAVTLKNGSNQVWYIPGTETPLKIDHIRGYPYTLPSVKYNNTEVAYTQYQGYYINPRNGGVIDIVTYDPNATRYTLTFASGSNLNAIAGIQIGSVTLTSGWESGSISFEEGTSANIMFDNEHYEISDVVLDGYAQEYYGYPIYCYMSSNMELSYTATPKQAEPEVPSNTATFTLLGWDGNGLAINKGGSQYDTEVEFDATQFTVDFTEDTQEYYIYTQGDYRLTSVTLTHAGSTSNKTIYGSGPHYCIVEVADGDVVEVSVYKYVDVYTATLTVTADVTNYDGDITISNKSKHINGETIFGGTNTFKFDPTAPTDRSFSISSSTGNLYSVKCNGTVKSGTDGVYNLGYLMNDATVEIIAADPTQNTKTPAILEFSEVNNNAAIRSVLVNNIDLDASDYAPGSEYEGANVDEYFVIIFNPGYTISDLVFGNETYNYDKSITQAQPLDFNGENYQFSGYITEDYMPIEFTATEATVSFSKQVTFNVNNPEGVKVTDVTDSSNKQVLNINSTSNYHTFTNEYNYIDIEATTGYELVSVTINPNDGNASYDANINDNKVSGVMVDEYYIITIKVQATSGGGTSSYGAANVNVVGNPAQISLMNGSTNASIFLSAGDNSIPLWGALCTMYVEPKGYGIASVTVNGVEKTFNYGYCELSGIKDNDEIVIVTNQAPSTAVIYVDSFDDFASMSLGNAGYQAFTTVGTTPEAGYHVFSFTESQLGSGFTLNINKVSGGADPVVYLNNELQSFDNATNQLTGLMLADGDVIKVFNVVPEVHSLSFVPYEDAESFTITIDRINSHNGAARIKAPRRAEESTSNVQALTGTEIKMTASTTATQPWIYIDKNQMVELQPGGSYTFNADGDHSIQYGMNLSTTGIDKVMVGITGSTSADIFNLQGVCIKRNASGDDIKNLKPGVYVIGGHKVFVR